MKLYRSQKAKRTILETYDQLLRQWDVTTEERDIATACGTTHVIVCGDATHPPLVLFHGVGDDSALMWLYNARALAAHFRLYTIDTLGGPGKSCPNANYNQTFSDVQWIDETLDGLALDTVCIAGVSNGAYLAQLYGLHRPQRVRRMVCMAGSVPVGDHGPMKTMMKIFLPEALFPTQRNTIRLLRKLSGAHSDAFTGNPIILAHYQALLKGFNNMAMRYHTLQHFTGEEAAAIRDQTLYLIGEADPFAQLGGKAALLAHHMRAKFFPDAGHGINHELPDAVNREIIRFLLPDSEAPTANV